MFNFQNAQLQQMALHLVGNKGREEGFKAGKEIGGELGAELKGILQDFFLNHFKTEDFYTFSHPTDLSMNELFNYCTYIFEEPDAFYAQSLNILEHLYHRSFHPSVQSGELYVVVFDGILVEDEIVKAIGIFKTEHKETFIKVVPNLDSEEIEYDIQQEKGTSLKKLDKGALILNMYADEGYRVLTVDVKGNEARYWIDDFLMLQLIKDNKFYTKNYMQLCQTFVKESLVADKIDQATTLNKTVDYFSKNESFNFDEFSDHVFEDRDVVQEFKSFKQSFTEKNVEDIQDDFFIEHGAVEKMKKKFKNIIKLDSNIEIKIGSEVSDDSNIEKGYDSERKLYYYKLFFGKED